MFLKKYPRQKNGKVHAYWAVVESYRTARGPRSRIVGYLGGLRPSERRGWAEGAREVPPRGPQESPGLWEEDREPVPEKVTVRVGGVQVEETKDFGDVWLGWVLWRKLGLDGLFQRGAPEGAEEVPWGLMAAILAMGRLCDPSSELHVEDTWYPRTALPEVLGVGLERVYAQRLYRTLDVIGGCKEAVEKHLRQQWGELFGIEYDLVLYDVTSTYFEGEAQRNPQAQRGYSRDHRPDCKQVCIGRVVTPEGFPLGYEVFAGNRADVTTVEEIVRAMERKYGRARRIWVLDRGMVEEDNLAYLRERGGSYIVGTPRSQLKAFEPALTEAGWTAVYEDVEVKRCPSPEGTETFVLCRSQGRMKKERAIHQKASERIEAGLRRLAGRLARTRKAPDRAQVERQIGRLLQQHSRAAGKYQVRVEDDPNRPGQSRLTWACRKEWEDWASLREGAYLLRTNLNGMEPAALWKMYMPLADAEESFRTVKWELDLRPIFHQKEDRVQAHILVAFLAYAMGKTLQGWMERAGLGRGVRTVLEEFGRIKCNTVVLPTDTGRKIELRCITRPDGPLRVLLDHLGLKLPTSLGAPRWRRRLSDQGEIEM